MSSPCGPKYGVVVPNHESLRRVLSWLLPPAIFAACRGGDKWKPRALAFAAMLWAWGEEPGLKKRFAAARKVAAKGDEKGVRNRFSVSWAGPEGAVSRNSS